MTNDIALAEPIAPVYRYFVEDLLTGRKLAELDFRGVSYKLALNAAGEFQGSLIVKSVANAVDLYEATLPGITALYIMRNGVCVWGGIIWDREYIPDDKKLTVSASEFTSYLHHRKIWKTWNHEYGATVSWDEDDQRWRVVLDYGSNVDVRPGSTVKLEMYDVEDFKYNGYYRVALDPAPTRDEFTIHGGYAVADVTFLGYTGTTAQVWTKENHGFNTGDVVKINYSFVGDDDTPTVASVSAKITAPAGSASNFFTYASTQPQMEQTVAEGVAMRPLPEGTYEKVTVGVRQDTYDYVRSLVEGTFEDFVGTNFPNVYIEPGISTGIDIISKQSYDGYSILKTAGNHNIAVGQAVQIQDVGKPFDGEFEVTGIEEGDSIVYRNGGDYPLTAVNPINVTVSGIEAADGIATLTTAAAHGLSKGLNVQLDMGLRYPDLTGSFKVYDTPSSTKFRVKVGSKTSYAAATISDSTATVGGNVKLIESTLIKNNTAVVKTKEPHGFSVGNSVTVSAGNRSFRIVEKSLDGPSSIAYVQTDGPHYADVGDTVSLVGLSDSYGISAVSSSTTKTQFKTSSKHNIKVGNSVTIGGQDRFKLINKAISSNVATLQTEGAHNIPNGTEVTITGVFDKYTVNSVSLNDNVAYYHTSVNHNVAVNDTIAVSSLKDTYSAITKSADKGTVRLTLSRPHNIQEGQKIVITGMGLPFDGTVTVTSFTDQRITYKVDSKHIEAEKKKAAKKGKKLNVPLTVAEQKTTGTITVPDSYFNGTWTVASVTSNQIRVTRAGNNYPSRNVTGYIKTESVLNGVYTTTASTSTTFSFAKTANNSASVSIPKAVKDDEIQALVELQSVYTGTYNVQNVTADTFGVLKNLSYAVNRSASLSATKPSIFSGNRTITSVTADDRFTFSLPGYPNSMIEKAQSNKAYGAITGVIPGTYTITAVDNVNNTFSFAKTHSNWPEQQVQNRGTGSVTPLAIVSTFGPFPGNADLQFVFPDNEYSGINIEPAMYRGFELKTVGEALDEYASNIDGFEYRIDCEYDAEQDKFIRKFVLLPINFPDAPEEGEVSPISRFGADKLVFEYPAGSVTSFSIRESAEDAATRFFAVGEHDLGPDVGPFIGVASADTLLRGEQRNGRRWPLLDASDTVDGIDDKTVLHAYAKRFLSEMEPPFAEFKIAVNGSRPPYIDTYKPGDWCSIVVNDPWMQMRLASDLEPRNDVIVRKIDSISVSVPDGVTYPEAVTVNLVAEWEVDKRGK